jgi:hypothetical protein
MVSLLAFNTSVPSHLISGQFVKHCQPFFLQRIQPASSLDFLRDIQAHSLMTLLMVNASAVFCCEGV